MSDSYEEVAKLLSDRLTEKSDADMSQDIFVVAKGGRGNKVTKDYNFHYNIAIERLPFVFGVSGYCVPKVRGKAESGNKNYHDIQFMYVGNIQKIKYLVEHALNYDLGDVININKLTNALEDFIKEKWDFNDQTSLIKHWTNVDIATVKYYQWYVNQFSTDVGVSSNWFCDLLHN